MGELLVGGALGLLVAVVSQWVATGGRLKRLRATIREELELADLLKLHDDPLRVKLKLQARLHLLEYLDDADLDPWVRRTQRKVAALLWACVVGGTLVVLTVVDTPESPVTFVVAAITGIALGVLVLGLSSWIARQWVRHEFRTGVHAEARKGLALRLGEDEAEEPA